MPDFKQKSKPKRMDELPGQDPVQQPFQEGSRKEAVECVRCVAPAFCDDSKLVCWAWERLKEVVGQ
jgi:hypothetical protein